MKVQQYQGLWKLLCLVTVLNAADAIFTAFWVKAQLATEANPLMEHLLNYSIGHFIVGKIVLVGLCCWLIWRLREGRLAYSASIFGASLYLCIVAYHLWGAYHFFF
jgi:hypothetical protein